MKLFVAKLLLLVVVVSLGILGASAIIAASWCGVAILYKAGYHPTPLGYLLVMSAGEAIYFIAKIRKRSRASAR